MPCVFRPREPYGQGVEACVTAFYLCQLARLFPFIGKNLLVAILTSLRGQKGELQCLIDGVEGERAGVYPRARGSKLPLACPLVGFGIRAAQGSGSAWICTL